MNTILNIDKLTASIEIKLIIDNFNLNIGEGETPCNYGTKRFRKKYFI